MKRKGNKKIKKFGSCLTERIILICTLRAIYKTVTTHRINERIGCILEFIWSGKDVTDFEQWLYEQNSIEFENLIGEENYVEVQLSLTLKRRQLTK